MAEKQIEIIIKGHHQSSMTAVTADLIDRLLGAKASVKIDSSVSTEVIDLTVGKKKHASLEDVVVTVKNQHVAPKARGESFRRVYGADVVQFANGDEYDICTDKLIPVMRVLEITQLSRYMLQRRIEEGKFPEAHFAFGPNARRWVERLVINHVQNHWTKSPV